MLRLVKALILCILLTVSIFASIIDVSNRVYASNDKYNYAPYFTANGSNHVSIPDDPSLRLTQFSVSAWFRTTINNNTLVSIIVNKGGFQSDTAGTPQQNYGIWITGSNQGVRGKVQAGFEDANGRDYFVTSPNTYNDGNWHYAVVTYDGSVLRLYVDGSLVATMSNITATPHTNNTPLVIGKDSNGNNRYFIGDIDEVRVYNRALSAQEVSDAYNNGIFSNDGLVIRATFTPPIAEDKNITTTENSSIDVILTGIDPDNYEQLTFSIVNNPSNGTLSSISQIDSRSAKVTYTPNPNFYGVDTFTYTITDGIDTATAIVTIEVMPVNDAPIANDDFYSINQGEVLSVDAPGVLSNDTDPDGNTLFAEIVDDPTNGTLEFREDGSFTYTPNPNFTGIDTFTYRARDNNNAYSNTATVTITVNAVNNNNPPIANNDFYSIDEDTTLTVDAPGVLSNDTDPDDGDTITITGYTNPSNGTLTFNNDGSFTYTPNPNFYGVDTFTYTITDNRNASATATVTITVNPVNDAPIANAGADKTVDEGTLVTLDGSASYDPDGDPITYQWEQIQGPTVTLNNANTANPSFTAPFVNSDTILKFRLTVSDGSLSSSSEVTITVKDIAGGYRYEPYFTANGSNYVSIPDRQELRLQKFSVSAWFRTTMTNNSSVAIIVNKGGFGNGDGNDRPDMNYGIWITGSNQGVRGKVQAGFEDANGEDYFVTSPNTYNDGNWHYAVVTYDGSVLRLYVDGQQVASLNTNNAIPDYNWDTPLTIGKTALPNVNSNYFIGDIDEVRVYNRALSAQEVSDAYNNGIFSNDGLLVKIGFAPPIANAGADKTVDEGTLVTLDGSASYDPDGDPITYQWEQIQGPSVTLSDPNSPTPSFTAPFVDVITTLKFRLTVSDGSLSSNAVVYVYVRNISAYDYYPWFTLKGTDSYSIPDDPSLRLTQFSVSAWFRTSSTFTTEAMIVNKGGFGDESSGKNMNYGIWLLSDGKVQAGFEESNGMNRFVTSPNRYNDGNWHYAVVTYDGSVLRLYVDGQQVASLNINVNPDTNGNQPLTIGKNSLQNNRYFIGDIDEVRVYNRALSAQEVSDAYNGTFTNYGLLVHLDMRHELLLSGVTNMEDKYYFDLLNEIKNAKRKIHLSTYWLEYKSSAGSNYRPNVILNAIKDAKNRGVDIRVMYYYESAQAYPDLKSFLTNNAIPYKEVVVHAKIINIDDRLVYLGSGNININGLRNNHEIFIKSYNANIIDRATKYLDRLWTGSGSRAFADDGYDNIVISNGYFDSVLNAINNARNKIRIVMFNMVNEGDNSLSGKLLIALNNAKNRGVDIKVIVDGDWDGNNDGIPDNISAISYLKSKGIPVKSDEGEPPRTHIKLVIIDDTTYIGSHNWISIQLASVEEASVKLRSQFILQDAIEYFDWKWSRGRDL